MAPGRSLRPRARPMAKRRLPVNGRWQGSAHGQARRESGTCADAPGACRAGAAQAAPAQGAGASVGPPRGRRRARQSGAPASQLWATREAIAALDIELPADFPVTFADVADLGRLVPRDAPHQGIVAEVERLDDMLLADLLDGRGRRARCSCSTRSPIRTMSARSCARRRPSTRSASSPRTATRRPNRARSPRRRPARSRPCPGCASSTSPARSRRSPRPASGGSGWPARRRRRSPRRSAGPVALVLGAEGEGMRHNIAGALRRAGAAADQRHRKPQRLQRRGDRALCGGDARLGISTGG